MGFSWGVTVEGAPLGTTVAALEQDRAARRARWAAFARLIRRPLPGPRRRPGDVPARQVTA